MASTRIPTISLPIQTEAGNIRAASHHRPAENLMWGINHFLSIHAQVRSHRLFCDHAWCPLSVAWIAVSACKPLGVPNIHHIPYLQFKRRTVHHTVFPGQRRDHCQPHDPQALLTGLDLTPSISSRLHPGIHSVSAFDSYLCCCWPIRRHLLIHKPLYKLLLI